MKIASLALALGIAVAAFAAPQPAESKTYFSFGIYGPGYHFGHGYYPYYHRPYFYYPPPYYYHRRHYRPYRYRRVGRCGYWRRQCIRNWGYRNSNFYGCLRYHRC